MAGTQMGYLQLALRDGHDYLVQIKMANGLSWSHSLATLTEAIDFVDGSENAALFAVEEPVPGLAMQSKLADILFGEWYIEPDQEELTMAKVKKVRRGDNKDMVAELLGDNKAKKTRVMKAAQAKAQKASKAANGRKTTDRSEITDDMTIKVLKKEYPGNPREGSNLHTSLSVLKSGMTVGQWQKARAKKGIERTGNGYLRQMIADGYVRVR